MFRRTNVLPRARNDDLVRAARGWSADGKARSGRCRYSLLCCWSWRGCSECLARHPRAAKDGDVLQSLGQGETRTPLRLAFRLTSECTCVQYVSSYERMNACNSTRTTRLRRTFPHPSVLAANGINVWDGTARMLIWAHAMMLVYSQSTMQVGSWEDIGRGRRRE